MSTPKNPPHRDDGLIAGVYRAPPRLGSWPAPPVPGPDDLVRASTTVHTAEPASPLLSSPSLSNRYDRHVSIKLESTSAIRSFKFRGALVAVDRIARETEADTVITASTGNHGQGIAYAASRAGLTAIVYVPEGVPAEKLGAMRALGARIRVAGAQLDDAAQAAQEAAGRAAVYLEDGENPDLMAGAATVMEEILQADDAIDTVLVPIGGGNLIAGSLLARQRQGSGPAVVGVQSTAASSATESWLRREVIERDCSTFAGGLATTRPGLLSLHVMIEYLGTSVLVDDEDLYTAMGMALETASLEIEGAAAAPIAALERFGDSIEGERVAIVATGNWPSQSEVEQAIRSFEDSGLKR